MVGVVMMTLQYRTLLAESQSEILVTLRDKRVAFHGLCLSVTTHLLLHYLNKILRITALLAYLSTALQRILLERLVDTKHPVNVDYPLIWEKFPGFGLDARNLYDTVEDEEDEERTKLILQVTRGISAIALTFVHYLYLIFEEEDTREMSPPIRPLPCLECLATIFRISSIDLSAALSLVFVSML